MTVLNATSGSLKRDLIERVYIPKGPLNPNSYIDNDAKNHFKNDSSRISTGFGTLQQLTPAIITEAEYTLGAGRIKLEQFCVS